MPGVLQSMKSQRVGQDWATEQQQLQERENASPLNIHFIYRLTNPKPTPPTAFVGLLHFWLLSPCPNDTGPGTRQLGTVFHASLLKLFKLGNPKPA